MAKTRMVNTKLWTDSYVLNLDPSEKLLFVYLITNPYTEICGIYELALKIVAVEIGLEKETIQRILKRFEHDGKVIYRNGWIAIKNFIKNQSKNPKVEIGINAGLEKAPQELKNFVKGIGYDSLSHLDSDSDFDSELIPVPRNAEEIKSPISDSYLSKFSLPTKVHGPIQALATEIYESTGKREKFPALCGIIKRKGVNFAREQWQEVSKSPVRDKLALFKYRMGKTKVELHTKS